MMLTLPRQTGKNRLPYPSQSDGWTPMWQRPLTLEGPGARRRGVSRSMVEEVCVAEGDSRGGVAVVLEWEQLCQDLTGGRHG